MDTQTPDPDALETIFDNAELSNTAVSAAAGEVLVLDSRHASSLSARTALSLACIME